MSRYGNSRYWTWSLPSNEYPSCTSRKALAASSQTSIKIRSRSGFGVASIDKLGPRRLPEFEKLVKDAQNQNTTTPACDAGSHRRHTSRGLNPRRGYPTPSSILVRPRSPAQYQDPDRAEGRQESTQNRLWSGPTGLDRLRHSS